MPRLRLPRCRRAQDQKKYWNELVHLCLFFISPHQLKRADVELMRRLHALVPLVVVIAKSEYVPALEPWGQAAGDEELWQTATAFAPIRPSVTERD